MNKIKKILSKPYLAIALLVLTAIFTTISFTFKNYNYDGKASVQLNYIYGYQEGTDRVFYLDEQKRIYCVDKSDNLIYLLDNENEKDSPIYFAICVGDNNHLYVHQTIDSTEAYLSAYEAIAEYDENGDFVKYIAYFDYKDAERPPQRKARITGLNYNNGHVRYIYKDYTDAAYMYSCDPSTLITECEGAYKYSGYERVAESSSFSNGDYAVIMNNGEVGRLAPDGTYTMLAGCDYTLANGDDDYVPIYIHVVDDQVYIIGDSYAKSVFTIEDDEVYYVTSYEELTGSDDWGYIIDSIADVDGDFSLFSGNERYKLDENDEVCDYEKITVNMPFSMTICKTLKQISPVLAIVFGIIGFILLIGAIAKWKSSLLLKQLCMTIPLVIILVVIIIYTMYKSLTESYEENLTHEMVAINELITKNIDSSDVAKIKGIDAVNEGLIQKYCDLLNSAIDHNKGYWNKKFDIKLLLFGTDEYTYFVAARNSDFLIPFTEVYYDFVDPEEDTERILPDTDSTILYVDNGVTLTEMVVDTPVYDSNGKKIGVVELSADCSTVTEQIKHMARKVIAYAILFLVVICIALGVISYINIRQLGRLNSAVAEISNGDFKVRIKKLPKNEVGDICVSVNQMAEQLDDYFTTKDKNEKFYYKFVPEKFKELLHKDDFTELALGDAESADLTVLFCDIRAFSLNSEMMTAKENFEFVNVIYGKAGPIIREHNGFVDKYIGDAIMALFENADDAIMAGREIYKQIVLNPETAKELNVSSINIGVGIHSGMARIGIVGENERMSGTVISNTVNLSSRLESLTKRYAAAMLISKDTLDRLSDPDSLNTRYLGMIQVAGVNEVKAVYEVLDCLGDEDCALKTSQKDDFREAIRLFHLGNPTDAISILKNLQANKANSDGNDPAIDLYLDYIEEELAAGNKDHKIFRFEKK